MTRIDLPGDKDLHGAMAAILRLQYIYKLETKDLAHGKIKKLNFKSALSADDCFEIGKHAYEDDNYYQASLWFTEAIQILDRKKNDSSFKKNILLEYTAYSFYQLWPYNMNQSHVLTYESDHTKLIFASDLVVLDNDLNFVTKSLLNIEPNHSIAQGNKLWYEYEISELEQSNQIKLDDYYDIDSRTFKIYSPKRWETYFDGYMPVYSALCRGDKIIEKNNYRKGSTCRYMNRHKHPLLLLAPIKEEVLYTNPWIAAYHNVITDAEINILKTLAQPQLKRATVVSIETFTNEIVDDRVSKSAWLDEVDTTLVESLNLRINAITGLDMLTSESLQIGNYGIGGHYDPHYDFSEDPQNPISSRLATFMFYLSDINEGGATVFPKINLRVQPVKGSGIFWYNLYVNRSGNHDTRHAGCPVLLGSKWVANKWIHQFGNNYKAQCKSKYQKQKNTKGSTI
ncbi:prolyl 4-hydroxylase subunit alpha-1-like [Gordionus sp. m RMFG-2023]|uniref:prolyl 4-hydroxylase subunit alpha-1-like n=1 Tax=Gordionus sp. m RMFG-2023 TaxID=3053472 RepID=UPI0031FBBEFF